MSRALVSIRAFGHPVRLDLSAAPPVVQEQITHLWARCLDPDPPPPEDVVVVRPTGAGGTDPAAVGGQLVEYASEEELPYELSRTVTMAALTGSAGRFVLLHAAGLHDAAADRFVALVAPAGTGKSTACRVVGRTLGYVTDETVCLDEDLVARPYPKPLSIIRDGGAPDDKAEFSPDELGLAPTPAAPRLGGVVLLNRDPKVGRPRLVPLDPLDAIALLLPDSSGTRRLPDPLRRFAEVVTAGPGAHRLDYGDITDCTDLLHEHLARAVTVPEEPRFAHIPPPEHLREGAAVGGAPRGPAPEPGIALVRAPYVDAIAVDHDVLLLQQARTVRLRGLSTLVWFLLEEPMDRGRLLAEVRADLGPHPDAERLVAAAVDDLWDVRAVIEAGG